MGQPGIRCDKLQDPNDDRLSFGPTVSWKGKLVDLLANPFFERTIGQNHEEGMALTSTWCARYDLGKGPRAALEGLGRIENLDDLPPFPRQMQIYGPASNQLHNVLIGLSVHGYVHLEGRTK